MRRQHHHIRGHSAPKGLVGIGACACALVFAGGAQAQQNDINPPLPDVMLLLDTSGSMELMMDGCNPDTGQYPDGSGLGTTGSPTWCNAPVPTPSPAGGKWCDGASLRPMNRWQAQVAALTGSYPGGNVACIDESRTPGSNTPFVTEYSLKYGGGNAPPYDANYFLDYHRPAQAIAGTKTCVIGFNQTTWSPDNSVTHPATQADFNTANIGGYQLDTSVTVPVADPTKSCTFQQNTDGIINVGNGSIRFGLMTFDNDTLPGTGVSGGFGSGFTDVVLATPPTSGMWSYYNGWLTPPTGASVGRPAGCAETGILNIPFEVGARNPAAPPWEGRMMQFPTDPTDTTGSTTNGQIIKAIEAMRPYGANPIAGMLDDAKYYFWQDPQGPALADPLAACRKQYIILLSHAAPNLDLETYCQGTAGGFAGICPYDYPEYIAGGLRQGAYVQGGGVTNAASAGASGPPVLTYVVGFVPSSDLGGTSTQKCSDVVDTTTSPATIKSAYCGTEMTNGVDAGAGGNPVYASCCALARIAAAGGTGAPLFADNATDLGAALQTILSLIIANETTRATPVILPQTANTTSTGGASSATFISSFAVSTSVPWSGDVQRERAACSSSSGVWGAQLGSPPIDPVAGDDFAVNLLSASQANTARNVLIVEPNPAVSTVPEVGGRPANGNVRPWINGTGTPSTTSTGVALDNYSEYDSKEFAYTYTAGVATPPVTTTDITTDALGFAGAPTATCGFTSPVQSTAFTNTDCENIVFNYLFGNAAPGTWSADTTGKYPSRAVAPASPFGAVYHSTPAVATPPSALLRDDSYQNFIGEYSVNYATGPANNAEPRHTVLYVATLDGLLHAFGVDYSSDKYTYNGSNNDANAGTSGTQNELWSFVPPAVLPKLMGATGPSATGHLDGAPVVKDSIYERLSVGSAADWHTSLVAGFGKGQQGYYALDVTDPALCRRNSSGKCSVGPQTAFAPAHVSANSGTPSYMTAATVPLPQGPHFLWQLTFQNESTDLTATTISNLAGAPDDSSPNLFAANSVTPAITTVYIHDPDDGVLREIGVAILPGGAAEAPAVTSPGVGCPRSNKVTDASPSGYDFDSNLLARQWGSTCTSPVAGRSLTVVRLDNGEVLRTFVQQADYTSKFSLYGAGNSPDAGGTGGGSTNGHGYVISGRVTEADFDSPMSGTPVPYPADVGAIAQKVFIGDEDGVIWRLDLSNPLPTEWFVEPFIDSFNAQVYKDAGQPNAGTWAADRQPISGSPNVTIGLDGHLVLNFGTGDVNNIGTSYMQNYVYSVSEKSNATASVSGTRLIASVNWYDALPNTAGGGEMLTGPATVFDGVYYFATYAPPVGGAKTCATGLAYLWGMDFVNPEGSGSTPSSGGLPEMVTTTGNVQFIQQGSAIIPGVAITSTAVCAATTTGIDPVSGGTSVSLANVAPAQYSITALVGASPTSASTTGGTNTGAAVKTATYNIVNGVHTSTLVDSWASIVE
jgi:type IV pilus assembly protein PilY1